MSYHKLIIEKGEPIIMNAENNGKDQTINNLLIDNKLPDIQQNINIKSPKLPNILLVKEGLPSGSDQSVSYLNGERSENNTMELKTFPPADFDDHGLRSSEYENISHSVGRTNNTSGEISKDKNEFGFSVDEFHLRVKNVQQLYKKNKISDDSDTDSDDETEHILRNFAKDDIIWFDGLGFHLSIDTSILFSQISFALIVVIFCIYKLSTDPSCDTTATYAPLLSAIVGYIIPGPISARKSKKDK